MDNSTINQVAVLGSPISHSLSPTLHRAAYAALGLDWVYSAIEVKEEELATFVATLDSSWVGLSLTMPLKEVAFEVATEVDEVAKRIRSINTLLRVDDGWRGTNTDVFGIVNALVGVGVMTGIESAVVLGAGATARSAIAALSQLNATSVKIAARRPEQVHELIALAGEFGLHAQGLSWEPEAGALHADIVISTLPGSAGVGWAEVAHQATGALLDAAYHPWPTPLAANWPNTRIASGRDMLIWQAAEQVRLMTGRPAPVEAMRASLPVSSD
jgi:shikimate dehydrogenase